MAFEDHYEKNGFYSQVNGKLLNYLIFVYFKKNGLSGIGPWRRRRVEIEAFAVVQVKDDCGINQTGSGAGEGSPQICRQLCFCLSD